MSKKNEITLSFNIFQSACGNQINTTSSGGFCEILITRQKKDCPDKILLCNFKNCPILKQHNKINKNEIKIS
jgi:hypothetical protein